MVVSETALVSNQSWCGCLRRRRSAAGCFWTICQWLKKPRRSGTGLYGAAAGACSTANSAASSTASSAAFIDELGSSAGVLSDNEQPTVGFVSSITEKHSDVEEEQASSSSHGEVV